MPRKRIAQVCCYKVSCPTSKAQYYSILAWHGMIGKSKAIVAHSRVNEWKQVCAHQGKKGTRSLARTYFKSRWTLFLCLWQFAEILLLLHMPYRRRAAARPPAPARVKLGVSQAGSYVRRALTGKRPLRFLGEKFHPPTHGRRTVEVPVLKTLACLFAHLRVGRKDGQIAVSVDYYDYFSTIYQLVFLINLSGPPFGAKDGSSYWPGPTVLSYAIATCHASHIPIIFFPIFPSLSQKDFTSESNLKATPPNNQCFVQ